MRISYHPDYRVDLPPSHPYPMGKYPLLHDLLCARGLLAPGDIMEPQEVSLALLGAVHEQAYLAHLAAGTLAAADVRRLGVPLTARLWRRSRLAVHGTVLAAEAAIADGMAANLAGGTHHAFADHGEGFCVLNDVAVAIHALRGDSQVRRALVVDLDVHQGNGTASILAGEPGIFTFSMHQDDLYPSVKPPSSLDVGLPAGTGDQDYLRILEENLPQVFAHQPELVVYQAGVDGWEKDLLGGLKLTAQGLRRRDAMVYEACRGRGVPVAVTLGGGYGAHIKETARLHAQTLTLFTGRGKEIS